MDNTAPPLRLWLYVLINAVFIVSVFFGYAYLKYTDPNASSALFIENLQQAIIKNDVTVSSKSTIVVLGSSLSSAALPHVSELEKKIAEKGKNVSILRISIGLLNMEEAEHTNFFHYITKYPPQYLFIESNWLNIDNAESDKASFFPVALLMDDIERNTRKILGFKENDFNKEPSRTSLFYADKIDSIAYHKPFSRKLIVRRFSDNKIANSAYAELVKKKTKIIFLDFPRSPAIDSGYLNAEKKRELKVLLDSYFRLYGIEYWKYPGAMAFSDFQDRGHLNYRGAKKYDDWFVSQFNKLK